jgi:hypothetical protein
MARKVSTTVDANGDKIAVSVESTWTGGSSGSRTRLDRRQLRWMESTELDLSLASQPLEEPSTQDLLGGLPKMLADRDDEDLLSAMEGTRVVANNCGDLRVWSVKDVFAAVFYTNGRRTKPNEGRIFHRGGRSRRASLVAENPRPTLLQVLTRLKFSLRGRALWTSWRRFLH